MTSEAVARADVVVIGGGPAGTCAAIAAARAGLDAVLVERRRYPKAKACGCCLSDAAVGVLEALGAGDLLSDAIPIRSVRLVSGRREVVIPRAAGAAISRRALDARLATHASAAGVRVLEGAAAEVVGPGLVRASLRGSVDLRARCIVVADGLGGTSLDGVPGFGWKVQARSRIGIGAELAAGTVDCAPGEIRMHVSRAGYVGCVRLEDGTVDVAAAVCPRALRSAGSPGAFACAALGPAVRAAEVLHGARWSGTPLLTRRRASVAARGILVAGDAAGYVEPFTGEGIGWAMMTGIAAGRHAAACVADPQAWRSWPRAWHDAVHAPRLRCRMVAAALRHPWLVSSAVAVGAAVPGTLAAVAASIGRRPDVAAAQGGPAKAVGA